MYLHKTKNGHYTPPCCYFSGELEVVEILRFGFCCNNSCYFAGSKHYRPMLWPCNVDSNEDGAAFLLGYDKVMEASKLAVHSEDSIKKIRARLSSGKR